MKVYKVTKEELNQFRSFLSKFFIYRDNRISVDHEVFSGVPVVCELTGDMEQIDNKPIIDFINKMEA